MQYFSNFPLTPILSDKNTVSFMQDIFIKGNPLSDYKKIASYLVPYQILEGETPEIVSKKFYNSTQYHWVVLYFNNITDPRFDWPLSDYDLQKMIYENYDYEIKVIYSQDYSEGDILQVSAGTDNSGKQFIVKSKNGAENLIYIRSLSGIVYLDDTESFDNITKNTTNKGIQTVILPDTVINHYIDPTTSLVVDSTVVGAQPVTVFDYETQKNEKKRQILLLESDKLPAFVNEFYNIIRR